MSYGELGNLCSEAQQYIRYCCVLLPFLLMLAIVQTQSQQFALNLLLLVL